MDSNQSQKTQTEAVGVFDDAARLQEAVDALLSAGFDRAEISLLASGPAVEAKLGHTYKKAAELEDDQSSPRVAYVSTEAIGDAEGGLIGALLYVGAVAGAIPIVASGGTLAGAIAGATMLGGAGALIGSVLAQLVGDHHADYLREQLDHGGLLLWVRTRDKAHEAKATQILSKYSAKDVHLHALPALGA